MPHTDPTPRNISNAPDTSPAENSTRAVPGAAAALWASAFILMALLIVQSGRLTGGGPVAPAHADINQIGDLEMITTQGSTGEDLVLILDKREELMFVYGIDSGRRIQLIQFYSVPQIFNDLAGSRGAGGGAPR
ncbi:MAG: hypothetical protein ACTS3F_12710 [Phycisphaerales bacterium]